MANVNIQISIKEPAVANNWLQEVNQINEAYREAMKDAGDTLQSMADFCEGTIVDELVNYGTAICEAAQVTFEAINAIADTVNSILDKVSNFTQDVVGSIGSALGKVFGK